MKATWLISPNCFHVYQANYSCFSWDYLQKCIVDRYTPVWFLYAKCMHMPVCVCPPRAALDTAKSNSLGVIWESRTWVPVLTLVKRGNNNFYCPVCEHEMKERMWKQLMNYKKDSTHESRRLGKGREEACGETFGWPCSLDGDVGDSSPRGFSLCWPRAAMYSPPGPLLWDWGHPGAMVTVPSFSLCLCLALPHPFPPFGD